MAKKNYAKETFNELVKQMISEMESSNQSWIKKWSAPRGSHKNFIFKKDYRGMNALILANKAHEECYDAPYWMTFKQAKDKGGMVKKGEKATNIFFYHFLDKKDDDDDEKSAQKGIPFLKMYKVFNIEQIEGIEYELPEIKIQQSGERNEELENFIKSTKANIRYGGDQAFYQSHNDFVGMPKFEYFFDAEAYYSTIFHELIHWTGHTTRTNREIGFKKWGDESYAFEELVAELGSVFLCNHLGVGIKENRHPEYLKYWASKLRDNPQAMWKAASKAQQAVDFIIDFVNEKYINDGCSDIHIEKVA